MIVFFPTVVKAIAQRQPARLVVDTRAVCHVGPDQNSPAGGKVPFGYDIDPGDKVDANGTSWYLDEAHSTDGVRCWVYGPYTTESKLHFKTSGPYTQEDSARDREASWLAVIDHIIARDNVAFDEYVDVDNSLISVKESWPDAYTGRVQFRRLQMLSKALNSTAQGNEHAPLKLAWLLSHGSEDPFGGDWYVPPQQYWDLFDANRDAAWAEEVAWAAEQIEIPRDACMSNCMLDLMTKQPLQYWKRLPSGIHIEQVLAYGVEYAKAAAESACYDRDKVSPEKSASPVPGDLAAEIRGSLVDVGGAGKNKILKHLDEAEHKCGR